MLQNCAYDCRTSVKVASMAKVATAPSKIFFIAPLLAFPLSGHSLKDLGKPIADVHAPERA
jgi:hypothetical protein